MLTPEELKLEVLKLAVDRANKELPTDWNEAVANIYTRLYTLINDGDAGADKPRKRRGPDKQEADVFS